MLEITIPKSEFFDESLNQFVYTKETKLKLEHSLISISKWEAKWKKAFIGSEKNQEEILDYIKCMTVYPLEVDELIYMGLTKDNVEAITSYISDPMSATQFLEFEDEETTKKGPKQNDKVTSELIYYWMIANNIPVEFEKWHINRLLKLIKVCNVKNNAGSNKMSRSQILSRNRALNEARRAKYHSKG